VSTVPTTRKSELSVPKRATGAKPHGSRRVWGKSTDLTTLGARIQRARVENGMTQTELAQAIGATRCSVAGLEINHNSPSLARFLALAQALDVSLDYLAGLSPQFGKFPWEDA
jgi:DNA-binding XRE family transcriptional regulator